MRQWISKNLSGLAASSIIAILAMALIAGCSQKKPALAVGQKLPGLELTTVSGEKIDLPAAIQGKLAVILFWSKGCNYCKREMPLMQPLYDRHRESGFLIVGVHEGDDPGAVEELVRENGLTFPMFVDAKSAARGQFGVVSVPTMFVIAPDGSVKEKILGALPVEQLEKLVQGAAR